MGTFHNVPGCFSTNGGRDFGAFLSGLSGIEIATPGDGWRTAGFVRNHRSDRFGLAWRVLDAQFTRVPGFPFAIPQRRRRVFVVGYFGDWERAAAVLLEPDRLSWDTPPRRIKGAGVARSLTASTGGASGKEQQLDFVGGNGRPLNAIESGHGFYSESDVAQTLEAQEDQHRRNILCMATGQGGAETSEDCAVNLTCNHESPLICAGFCQGASPAAGSIGYHEQVSPTIKAGESGTAQVPALLCVHGSQDPIVNPDHANAVNRNNGLENCVCQYGDVAGSLTARHDSSPCADRGMNILCYENHAQDSRVKECGGCSPQINAKAGTGGGNLPLVQAIAIAENVIGRRVENGGNGVGAKEDVAYTQNCTDVMGVCQNATVRRLLPVECERLMGFPDNHTRIPWKGKPEEQCPDSPRYKACGNSMCVNVMRWLGERIDAVEKSIQAGTFDQLFDADDLELEGDETEMDEDAEAEYMVILEDQAKEILRLKQENEQLRHTVAAYQQKESAK